MNKKRGLLISIALTTALAVPLSAYAATSDSTAAKSIRGIFRSDASKLSDTQKADVDEYLQKAAQLQKEFINRMVENGSITKEQGDAEIKRIEDRLANGEGNGLLPGFGLRNGMKMDKGSMDKRMFIQKGIDLSVLNDAQKAQLTELYSQIAGLQKQQISKLVSYGILTQEQGDNCTKKIDEIINGTRKVGIADSLKIFNEFGGFSFFNMKGMYSSKLTEQQQTEMKGIADQITALQKSVIDKLVEFQAMTSEQGEALKSRLDAMKQDVMPGCPQKGMQRPGMKGDMNRKGKMEPGSNSGTNNLTPTAKKLTT